MKFLLPLIALLSFGFSSQAQEVWTYQPGPDQGKDAFIYDLEPSENFFDHPNFMASAWTNGMQFTRVRCLIDFLPQSLPEDIQVLDARLSLYSYDSPSNGPHSNLSGSNASLLQRIVEPWEEMNVTWVNQPETTTENQVTLEASTFAIQDYEDIDITALVQDMIANPSQGHGLMIRLITEDFYRAMVFGSGDNPNPDLRPKVVITYESTLSIEDVNDLGFGLYPNPTDSQVRIKLKKASTGELRVYDISGRLVRNEYFSATAEIQTDVSELPNGLYVVKTLSEHGEATGKLMISR